LWIYATLAHLWDTAEGGWLALLILFSVTFGVGHGQLPPVRFLLRTRESDDPRQASEPPPRT
jgi:hypothetical protein